MMETIVKKGVVLHTLGAKVPENTYVKFQQILSTTKKSKSDVIRGLIDHWISTETKSNDTQLLQKTNVQNRSDILHLNYDQENPISNPQNLTEFPIKSHNKKLSKIISTSVFLVTACLIGLVIVFPNNR